MSFYHIQISLTNNILRYSLCLIYKKGLFIEKRVLFVNKMKNHGVCTCFFYFFDFILHAPQLRQTATRF